MVNDSLMTMVRAASVVGTVVCMVSCGLGQETPTEALKRSFAEQVQAIVGIDTFERVQDELTFGYPNSDEAVVQWRVVIDSVTLEMDDTRTNPVRGDLLSSWYADGVLVEPLESMSRLPAAFLDAGVAQRCYALWDADSGEWGW